MSKVVYRPQLYEFDEKNIKTPKGLINLLRNLNPEISLTTKDDKKFMVNFAKIFYITPLDTSNFKAFSKSLYDAKIIAKANAKSSNPKVSNTKRSLKSKKK